MPLGWNAGCVVLTAYPSGVTWPSYRCGGPSITDAGEPGFLLRRPFSSSCARIASGASGKRGVQAQMSHWWFRNEPPKAPMKKLSASVYRFAHCHTFWEEPS